VELHRERAAREDLALRDGEKVLVEDELPAAHLVERVGDAATVARLLEPLDAFEVRDVELTRVVVEVEVPSGTHARRVRAGGLDSVGAGSPGVRSEVGHVGRGRLVVVGQAVHAVVTEEVLGPIGQFEGHAAARVGVARPEPADATGDGDVLATAVTGRHTHGRCGRIKSPRTVVSWCLASRVRTASPIA
jgi:hypothetical protein